MNKRTYSTHRGQTLVEFAIVLPVFLFLIVAIFDFGRAVYYYSAIHNAAREGARYGVIHPNDSSGMITRAENYAIGLGVSNIEVDPVINPKGEFVGGIWNPTIIVTVEYTFTPVTPLVSDFMPLIMSCGCKYLELHSSATMRAEVLP